jgi:hypothetical protein
MNNWFPVIQVDPNGPWREVDGVTCLVADVTDKETADDLRNGRIEVGQLVFEFQPNELEEGGRNEFGWGNLSKLAGWTDLSPKEGLDYILVYLARPYSNLIISDESVVESS